MWCRSIWKPKIARPVDNRTGMVSRELLVRRVADRVGFSLRLPSDCEAITGIGAEFRPGPTGPVFPKDWAERTVGRLMMHLGSTPEVAFARTILHEEALDENSLSTGISSPDTALSGITDYGKSRLWPLEVRVNRHRIRGMFSDMINERLGTASEYHISLIVSYRRKEARR